MAALIEKLKKDIHYIEGMNSCMNCGVCTAICPAAEFYNYDPRMIVDSVQRNDEEVISNYIKSDVIWYCGECMSCRTRCPRGNPRINHHGLAQTGPRRRNIYLF